MGGLREATSNTGDVVRPAPRPSRANRATKLAELRIAHGLTQRQLAERTGISIAHYRRLERDELRDPGVRALSNLAIALGVTLEDLVEDHWREWMVFDATGAPSPPA